MTHDGPPHENSRIERHIEAVTFQEAAEHDRRYWWSRTPEERMEHLERLRRLNYGDRAAGRLLRVLEIVEPE